MDPPPPADLKGLSCRDHYRRMLIGYDERVPFGPEAAWRLSGEFREARPDCAARGWAPEFGLERACFSTRVGGLYLSYDFLRRGGG